MFERGSIFISGHIWHEFVRELIFSEMPLPPPFMNPQIAEKGGNDWFLKRTYYFKSWRGRNFLFNGISHDHVCQFSFWADKGHGNPATPLNPPRGGGATYWFLDQFLYKFWKRIKLSFQRYMIWPCLTSFIFKCIDRGPRNHPVGRAPKICPRGIGKINP